MNKNMIMLISALVCANIVAFAAQKGNMQELSIIKEASVAEPLTTEENKIYQGLVAKFQAKNLTVADNTMQNIEILKKCERFLVQSIEVSNTSSLWPYWLTASLMPAVKGLSVVGRTMVDIGLPLPGTEFSERWGYIKSTPFDLPFNMMHSITSPLGYLPSGLRSVSNLLIYHALPLMALYVIHKKYNSLQSQQQELEMVRKILTRLQTFGESSK